MTETKVQGTRAFIYDDTNHLTRETDRDGRVSQFSYNAQGQLTEERWLNPDGSVAHAIYYEYNASGKLAAAGDDLYFPRHP